MAGGFTNRWFVCCGIALLVAATFAPVLNNGFVGYDDPDYVTANPHVNSGLSAANARWALTAFHANNWHPLTWISHEADCSLFGLNAGLHHLTSLLLHIANTLLLLLWFSRVSGSVTRSALVAAIFGVHPVHVESVAWVAERKDVLSALFGILTLAAYAGYVRRRSVGCYFLAAVLFAASLASKQTLVTLPLALLALDFWPLGRKERWARLVLEKLPLLALSAAASGAAIWAQRQGRALVSTEVLPMGPRVENAALSSVRYLVKTVWPLHLSVLYPYMTIPAWMAALSVLSLGAISFLVFRLRRGQPWLLTGWCWYLLTLFPVIGLVQVGTQSMADRYLYVPMIGLLMAAAWSFPERAMTGAVAVAVCAALSWHQVQYWRDGETLFRHAIAVTEKNHIAHDNLGVELDRKGRAEEALEEYREAVRIQPGDRHAEYNFSQAVFAKGERLMREGKYDAARTLFQEGLHHQPGSAAAHTYLGVLQALGGDPAGALASFDTALRLDPSYAPAKAARAELLTPRQ